MKLGRGAEGRQSARDWSRQAPTSGGCWARSPEPSDLHSSRCVRLAARCTLREHLDSELTIVTTLRLHSTTHQVRRPLRPAERSRARIESLPFGVVVASSAPLGSPRMRRA